MAKKAVDHNSAQFKRGLKMESKEHPELPKSTRIKLVEDHIRLHPRSEYMPRK